jgi:hypothetical protein
MSGGSGVLDRQSASILLIPLLAAFALLHPATNKTSGGGPPQILRSAQIAEHATGRESLQQWHGGREAVQNFFLLAKGDPGSPWAKADQDPRATATLKFLIATVPDPVDSGLPHSFDRFLAAIQAAVQAQSYFLSDFELPWDDCLNQANSNTNESIGGNLTFQIRKEQSLVSIRTGKTDKCHERRFTQIPGFLLFSNSQGDTSSNLPGEKGKPGLLLIYLIGENPTSGIHQRAFITALDEIASYCGWRKDVSQALSHLTGPQSETCSDNDLRILGPSFSGSAQSLDLALGFWTHSSRVANLKLTLISGSATAINLSTKGDFSAARLKFGSRFSFHSMELPDVVTLQKFLEYLSERELCLGGHSSIRLALLSEGNTAYGSIVPPTKDKPCSAEVTKIPYPLHISQLRAASERVKRTQKEASAQPQLPSGTLSLSDSLEDTGRRNEIPTFSPISAATSEQILASVLTTISREGYRYVGIFASDIRDTIFLAQEVHEHAPATVVFTFSADLLFLHPEINPSLRGMLVVSSYPLNGSNQLWSLPSHSDLRLQFSDDSSEGTYNAMLALLGHDDDILEFSPPFSHKGDIASGTVQPPVWISVVGRNRLWPIKAFDVNSDKRVQDYTYGIPLGRAGSIETAFWERGAYPQSILIFLTAFSILCIMFSASLIRCFSPRSFRVVPTAQFLPQVESRHARSQITRIISRSPLWIRSKWLDEVVGSPLSEQHRRQGELFLLSAAASLEAFLIIACTVSGVPQAMMAWKFEFGGWRSEFAPRCVVLVSALGTILLLVGMVSLTRAFKSNQKGWNWGAPKPFALDNWGPIAATSALVITLAVLLSGSWLLKLAGNTSRSGWLNWLVPASSPADFRAALFSSLRSLDLNSGLSALIPLFLISMAGFLWAMTSFHRARMLEGFESKESFLRLSAVFPEVEIMERRVRRLLQSRARDLPAVTPIFAAAVFLFFLFMWQFVRSFENGWFYALLGISYFCVMVALCLTVLRFFTTWRQTRHLLEHLAWTPMRTACTRFRSSLRTWPKVDLATPAPSLAPLALAIDQARTLARRASRALAETPTMVDVDRGEAAHAEEKASPTISDGEREALTRIAAPGVMSNVDAATHSLTNARTAASVGDWRQVLVSQYESQEALSGITVEISQALELHWWKELRSSSTKLNDPTAEAGSIFRLSEEFLAGRIFHLLAHVFPQMQLLIYSAVAGILLLLLAMSSYPFQPHNLLLLVNSAVILVFVITALWAFVEMNRDPILSSLNGTTPGQITWDKQFIFRLILYGVIPILALLGAHFPGTVGQILSSIAPAGAGH